MGAIQDAALNPTGPLTDEIAVIAVTAASAHTDLTADAAVAAAISRNEILAITSDDFDVWFKWSLATSGETVDETAVAGSNRAAILYVGERLPERPPGLCKGIVCKGRGVTKLRIYRASRQDF